MSRKDPRPDVSRRKFLAGVAVAGAATTVAPVANGATSTVAPDAASNVPELPITIGPPVIAEPPKFSLPELTSTVPLLES